MIVFMLSLAGIPSLAGFTGKFFLFSAAVERGYVWLVIIAALNSTVSIYYYAGVLVQMYMGEGTREVPARHAPPVPPRDAADHLHRHRRCSASSPPGPSSWRAAPFSRWAELHSRSLWRAPRSPPG